MDLFEAKSEQGTKLYYCKNKFCDRFGKATDGIFAPL